MKTILADDPIFSILGEKKPVQIDESKYTEEFVKAVAKKASLRRPSFTEDEIKYLSLHPDKVKNPWVEFVRDRFAGYNIPKNNAQEIFNIPVASNDQNGKCYIAKNQLDAHIKGGNIFLDELCDKYVYDNNKIAYISKNWGIKYTSVNTANYYHSNGKIHNCIIARQTNQYCSHIFSENKSYFVEHSNGANKSFLRPSGEAFGIEIEMSFKSSTKGVDQYQGAANKLKFASWVHDNYPDWICERDRSLEETSKGNAGVAGLELVSPPLDLETHKKVLPIILDKAKEFGATAFIPNNEFFGIHVTTNLYGKSTSKLGDRIVYFINNKIFRDFWFACAKRKGQAVLEYAPFFDNLTLGSAFASQSGSNNHYRAVNPRGSSALEVRIFRSTLAHLGVCAILDLMKITQDYCMITSSDLDNPSDFFNFINENADENLKEWLNDNGALMVLELLSKHKVSNVNKYKFEA